MVCCVSVMSSSSIRYRRLPTEQPHPDAPALDVLPTIDVLRLMHREDLRAVRALQRALPAIARAVALIVESLHTGGRLFFVGAGTSGRLGVLEAAECPPTFHTSPSLVQAIMAGGRSAVFRSREGVEDDRTTAARMIRRTIQHSDVVVGISASGATPFIDAALRTASTRHATAILITCNPDARIPADVRIVLITGPEVLAGSTRLKAGTATKLALNMLTLATMATLGKTYGHVMIDVHPTSRKLRARALSLIQQITHGSAAQAATLLRASHGRVKTAILMAEHHVSARTAERRLAKTEGSLRQALSMTSPHR